MAAGQSPIRASKAAASRLAGAIRAMEGIPRDRVGPSVNTRDPSREFWAEIGAPTADGSNVWQYDWMEVRRTSTNWETFDGARDSTTCAKARNSVEANNGGSGTMGNGINHSSPNYPSTFALQPIQGSPVRRMYVDFLEDGTACYTFEATNAEFGPCPEGA